MVMIFINLFVITIFCSLFEIKICQEETLTTVELNKFYNGTLESDYSFAHYKLDIPEGTDIYSKNLVFKVKEPDSSFEGKEDFSDPDIYVSTKNHFPKKPNDAEYYSEKFGEDLLSIPNSKVSSNKTFYFTIFCEKKCKYQVKAMLEPEWSVNADELYSFYLTKDNSISLKFDQNRETYEELEFKSYSPKMSAFRMFVSDKNNPSSSNSLTVVPSWVGGYYTSVTKYSLHFCNNCTYYILLESENDFAEIFFSVQYQDSVFKINPQDPIFSTLRPFRKHCYSIDVDENKKNENIIVQTMLFSGSANLLINPWKYSNNITDYKFVKQIPNEFVKLITPAERNNEFNSTGPVFICLKSYDYTSYLLKVYFESQTESLQKFNFLITGVTLNGYVPKGAVTRHRVTEFTQNSDIYFQMQVNSGNPQFYGYICEEARKCFFTKESLTQLKQNLTLSEKTHDGYKITIPNSNNTCHKKLIGEDSYKNDVATLPCAVFAIVYCEGEEDCSYSIRASNSLSVTKLKERNPHYQIVSYNQTDYYKFLIQDEKVENITIILNSITGDADMSVSGLNNTINKVSVNEGYSPDVVTITKESTNSKSLLGEYSIKVKGATFASYSILYYTHSNIENTDDPSNKKPIYSNIVQLDNGQIIRDFVTEFQNQTNYKIYSYNPKILSTQKPMDIRISLTPEHSEYNMYVLFDIENLVIEKNKYDPISNYIWKSTFNNELIINKNDINYKKDENYYIIIVPKYTYNNYDQFNNSTNSTVYLSSFFYIGVTNEIYPFVLQETYPISISLESNYTTQSFWYYHYNVSNPVSISLNVYYGRVDIYVDFKWSQNITASSTVIKVLDTDSTFFSIPPSKLKENSNNYPSIPLYITVIKKSLLDTQFLLAIKSNVDKPDHLKPGLVRQDSLLSGENKYFFINLRKTQSGLINIGFKYGYGNIYFNIYDKDDYLNSNNYPNITNYMFKGNDNYMGKSFSLSSDLLSKCQSTCKVLITIHGSNLGYTEDKIEYSLSYYQDALIINQNQPYRNEINLSEMKFFRVYFGKNTQNVYISLTNMNGDADLYVNYGDQLPSFEKSDWISATPNSEFVEFDKDDNYFTTNKLNDVAGNYTIMVYGYTKTAYTLYITSHPNKIVPIQENSPASCSTKKDNDYCYFRFDDLYQYYWGDNVIGVEENQDAINRNKDLNLIINTEFLYGGGFIYAKLYNDTDYDILQDFPDEKNYDYSNVNSNVRNLMKMNVKSDNPKYNSNSTILIAVKCFEKCFFDLIATKQYESTIKYFDYSRENIFYISKSHKKNLFIFYNNKQGDLDILVKALQGKAEINIYTNKTIYETSNNVSTFSHEIKYLANLKSEFPERENVHQTINYQNLTIYENLYFEINPISDYIFNMRLTYQHEWTKIKLGTSNIYKINPQKKRFYGYFHMHETFDTALLTVTLNNKNMTAYIYVKYDVYKKNSKESSEDYNLVPSEADNNFKGNTLNLMNLVAIRLPRVEKERAENNLVKILFSVLVFDEFGFEVDNYNSKQDIELKILISPEVNNISKSVIPQKTLFYSLLDGFSKNSTTHIYDLKRKNVEDDVLTIEISSCKGLVDLVLSKSMLYNSQDAETNRLNPTTIQTSNGRTVYKYNNIDSDNYYMLLNGRKLPGLDCRPGKIENKFNSCNNTFSNVLVFYYTGKSTLNDTDSVIPRDSIIYDVMDSSTLRLKWSPLIDILVNDYNNESFKKTNAEYIVYISNSISDYIYMDSICYLNNMNHTDHNIEIKGDSEAIIHGVKPNTKYFINVLARKKENSDVIAYKTIEVILKKTGPSTFTLSNFY